MEEEFKTIQENLEKINQRLDSIEKKTTKKWVLPVILVFLSALLTVVNYYVEKSIDRSSYSELITEEANTKFLVKEKLEFYDVALSKLNDLDKTFRTYCQFLDKTGQFLDSTESENLALQLSEFENFCRNQQEVDESIIDKLLNFHEFVLESYIQIEGDKDNQELIVRLKEKVLYLHEVAHEVLREGWNDLRSQ